MSRHGDWMQTASGRAFWPLDPRPDEIFIEDIAAALAKLCRYGGHTKRFYSVAEHSVIVSDHVPAEHRMWGLLHDASEAYLSDIIRPIKPFLSNYREIEERLMRAVAYRFDLCWPMPEAVKHIDNCVVHDEAKQMMRPHPDYVDSHPWNVPGQALGVDIVGWDPHHAEGLFLAQFHAIQATLTEPDRP